MKKLSVYLALMTVAVSLIIACGGKQEKPAGDPISKNPNGDSELAITMREMMAFSKELRAGIETKNTAKPYPESIKKILTAKETAGMIEDRTVFTGFANHYLATLDSVYRPGADLKKQFNATVTSCISCHNNYCQGPIPAIRKLYVAN